mmetsp:Transcript_7492/g.19664  ORF Transcript_7492/g.19664 Transcript_7492/m.19664 type:complete len:318 (-) Transcript_7492:534-1487(-)
MRSGLLPKKRETLASTAATRAVPPSKSTASNSVGCIAAASSTASVALRLEASVGSMSASNFARESDKSMCLGPSASAVINGSEIDAEPAELSSSLATSAASFSLWSARWSALRSMPCSFSKSSTRYCTTASSKRSPPSVGMRCAARTLHPSASSSAPTVASRSSTEKENARPPSAKTPRVRTAVMGSPSSISAAYAPAMASSSNSTRLRPARWPAAMSAARVSSVAATGAPTTAESTLRPPPSAASAEARRSERMRALSSSGAWRTPCTSKRARPVSGLATSSRGWAPKVASASASADPCGTPWSSCGPTTLFARRE